MPVIVLETRDFTGPLSLVRSWALLSGCVTFSLVATLDPTELSAHPQRHTFRILCMFTWCLFFVLTLLVYVLNIIQFHSLVPFSWKNLTVTVASLAALMVLSASALLPWMVVAPAERVRPRPLAATVASCLTALAYATEAFLIRAQGPEQRGYMASVPGLLKVLQFWGGCQMVPLVVEGARGGLGQGEQAWQLWTSGAAYGLCLVTSLGTVAVVLGDCAGRCPLPFDRLLAGFSLSGVLLYTLATILCFNRILGSTALHREGADPAASQLVIMESVVAGVTLLAYTADLAFSIKLLRDRSRS